MCLLGVICKVSNRKILTDETFCFLENVCYQYLNFVLRGTHFFFLSAADWPTTNFLKMYCYFPVIRLVNFGDFKQ